MLEKRYMCVEVYRSAICYSLVRKGGGEHNVPGPKYFMKTPKSFKISHWFSLILNKVIDLPWAILWPFTCNMALKFLKVKMTLLEGNRDRLSFRGSPILKNEWKILNCKFCVHVVHHMDVNLTFFICIHQKVVARGGSEGKLMKFLYF